ncbi:hypothetical protein O181_065608 [Austropuccinia psidii MF-1]|uniref:Uncharacterized protein n=1 Tax=Austropuccinia psidii MF-1 TaxID=1389203 RepID=A0A9Q3I2S3_9BASI|nr:hypothetical protein [Austropuccinia psidii MF-1]
MNPHGHKERSKSVSPGVTFLICFNLPPYIFYKPHHSFVSAFTLNPQESTSPQLNNILKPLVGELQEIWKGIHYPKAFKYPNGHPIKAALLLLLGDTIALHKIAGYASHSENIFFCHCNL